MSTAIMHSSPSMSSSTRQRHVSRHNHHTAPAVAPLRQHHVNPNGSMAVYAPGFKYVLNLPKEAIFHLPPASLNVTRLVLCSNYDARDPKHSCTMGERCKFVHADTGLAIEHNIHVNYAWRSIEEVTYERFPAGTDFHVAPPNTKLPADIMDSGLVLKTKALESTRRPLSHCAHYYFNRTCNLGSECHFIHAVFIDPTAKQHQRAPVPSQLGEGRELQMSKRQKEAHDEALARLALATSSSSRHHHHQQQAPVRLSDVALQQAAGLPPLGPLHLQKNSNSGFDLSVGSGSSPTSSTNSARGAAPQSLGSCGSVARYRHHPYDLTASRIITVACHC